MSHLSIIDKAPGKWVLVEFNDNDGNQLSTVSAIPGQWLVSCNESLMAYFPQHFSYARLKNAISKNIMYEDSWPIFSLKFIMPILYDTYQEARKDEHDVEEFEGTDLEDFARKKLDRPLDKRVRRPQGHRHASDNSDVLMDSDSCEEEPDRRRGKYGKLVARGRLVATSVGKLDAADCRKGILLPPLPSPPTLSKAMTISERSRDAVTSLPDPIVTSCSLQDSLSVNEPDGAEFSMYLPKENENTELIDLLRKVSARQEEMEKSVNDLNKKMDYCIATVTEFTSTLKSMSLRNEATSTLEEQRVFEQLFKFPIESKEQLVKFNEALRRDGQYKSFMVSFSKDRMTIPAADGPQQTKFNALANSIMKILIHNDLAMLYNMRGRTNSVKDSFENLSGVMDMIFQSMKEKLGVVNGPNISTQQSHNAVGEWLRQARGRTAEALERRRLDQIKRRENQRLLN